MARKLRAAAGAALIAVLVLILNVLPSSAQAPPPPIATEFLTGRAVFSDNVQLKVKIKLDGMKTQVVKVRDPSRTVVARFTVQPGAQFPWHSHAGPVVVNVVSGELTYVEADDCVERAYPADTAFVDPGQGHVHTAFNHTNQDTVIVATFYEAPASANLTNELAPSVRPQPVSVAEHTTHHLNTSKR